MTTGKSKGNRARNTRWGPRMILILIAMLTVSMAFFSGLYIQANLPFFPSLIGGFAIFLTLYGTLPKPKPATDSEELQARFALFENEIVSLSAQLEQFQDISGKIGQLDQLAPTLQQLEGFVQEMQTHGVALAREQGGDADLKINAFSDKLQQLDGRINALNKQVAGQGLEQQNQLQGHIESLNRLVQQMGDAGKAVRSPEPARKLQFDETLPPEEAPSSVPGPSQGFAPSPGDVLPSQSRQTVEQIRARDGETQNIPARAMSGTREEFDYSQMLTIISKAIKERHVDIFLQPVVNLPGRQTVYYEVFTRLRSLTNQLVMPSLFVPVAEQAGLMPLIDNMMLLRAIKIIRQMEKRTSARGLFCSLSTQSLVDPDFFPKLVAYLEKNRDLSGRIIFEISQAQKKTAGPIERDGMRRLARLGFRFSLDKVIDLDIDFAELAAMNFKFVRISADRLVNGMAELGARIHGADKADYLKRYGLHLIVERIETERELATLADYSISLGQGYLFAEPRPIRPELLADNAA